MAEGKEKDSHVTSGMQKPVNYSAIPHLVGCKRTSGEGEIGAKVNRQNSILRTAIGSKR